LKFIQNYKFLFLLLVIVFSCKLYKKDFDNPVDYNANDALDIRAPALVFYPKTQTINQNEAIKIESLVVFHPDSLESFTGLHFNVQFPNSLLELDTIKPGLFITDTSNSTPLFTYTFDGSNRIDIYAYFLSETKLNIKGTGHIADIIFNSKSAGTDSIYYDLDDCQMIKINDDEIQIMGKRGAEIIIQ
jgi:hypothetical protein